MRFHLSILCTRPQPKTWNFAKSYLSFVGICVFNVGARLQTASAQMIENDANKSLSFPYRELKANGTHLHTTVGKKNEPITREQQEKAMQNTRRTHH